MIGTREQMKGLCLAFKRGWPRVVGDVRVEFHGANVSLYCTDMLVARQFWGEERLFISLLGAVNNTTISFLNELLDFYGIPGKLHLSKNVPYFRDHRLSPDDVLCFNVAAESCTVFQKALYMPESRHDVVIGEDVVVVDESGR